MSVTVLLWEMPAFHRKTDFPGEKGASFRIHASKFLVSAWRSDVSAQNTLEEVWHRFRESRAAARRKLTEYPGLGILKFEHHEII